MDIMQLISGLRKMEEQALRVVKAGGPGAEIFSMNFVYAQDECVQMNFLASFPTNAEPPEDYEIMGVRMELKPDCPVTVNMVRAGVDVCVRDESITINAKPKKPGQ